jgi:CRISPR-associated endonuclease Cas2
MHKKIYLCCYDIANSKARNRVHKIIQQYQLGGQYSAYECYLTTHEKNHLEALLLNEIDEQDTLKLQVIHQVADVIYLGVASKPVNVDYRYFG